MTGPDLKAWRLARNLSQEAAATIIGISRRSVQAYEDSAKALPVVVLQSIRWVDHREGQKMAVKPQKAKAGGN